MNKKTESKKSSDEIQEYIKSKEEIFEFALSRRVLKIILFYLSIITAVLFIGGNSYINYVIKSHVSEEFSQRVKGEVEYLTEHNKITETGDRAIATAKIKYYEDLKSYFNKNISERIQIAAKAEILRIESFFTTGVNQYYPEEKVEYIDSNGEKTIGEKISTENLMKEYDKTDIIGKKTTILALLMFRNDKSIPEYLLKIAKETDDLRIRRVALCSLKYLLNDYNVNQFDYEGSEQLWNNKKEEYFNKAK